MRASLRSAHHMKEGIPWMSFISRWSSRSGCCWSEWPRAAPNWEGRSNDLALCARQRRVGGPAGLPRGRTADAGEVFMTTHAWTLLAVYSVVLLLLAIPLGRTIANV